MNVSTSTYSSTAMFSALSELHSIAPKYINTSSVGSVSAVSKSATNSDSSSNSLSSQKELQQSQKYQQAISELKARDQHVRAHERAHLSAAGGYATGGASYTYQVGPDGRRYAVGGEVGINTSPVEGDLQATIQKARIVQRAALAPSDPSAQDLKVHAQAVQMEMKASQELQNEKSKQNTDTANNSLSLASNGDLANQKGMFNHSGIGSSGINPQTTDSSRLSFEIRMRMGG
ncbi:putative metalloprotease CJM1_0395 family protein [Hydrogenovibrio kuenenii]|uniref:putative metalloprotease CJM1_0395 family protein n=1 Tax=Hydrogenovibrio kuenenii TaxID=63658 RepID=UPI00046644FD|nr:putative metalloprotease CJM1_0395 family protein [Hydrogenovibrio kuenenii]